MDDLESVSVECPVCGEPSEILVEADLGGELVQDCPVCCNPWLVRVRRRRDGSVTVTVEPAQ